MKFKIEMNAEELARGISSGALQALVGCDSVNQEPVQNMVHTTPAVVKEPEPAVAEVANVDTGTGMITGEAKPNDSVPEPVKPNDSVPEPVKPNDSVQSGYSLQQLALAGTQLCDMGKREEVLEVIKSFGAESLTGIPQARWGEYAEKLTALGASF